MQKNPAHCLLYAPGVNESEVMYNQFPLLYLQSLIKTPWNSLDYKGNCQIAPITLAPESDYYIS